MLIINYREISQLAQVAGKIITQLYQINFQSPSIMHCANLKIPY